MAMIMDLLYVLKLNRHALVRNLQIACGAVVNAAGPWVGHVHEVLAPRAPQLPVCNEVHGKVILKDVMKLVCRSCFMYDSVQH